MPDKTQLLWMYEAMEKARYYEDTIAAIYMEGKQPKFDIGAGPVPGENASRRRPGAVRGGGVHSPAARRYGDGNAPSHHVAIAKGVDLKKMTAESFGKKEGLAGGPRRSHASLDPAVNFACSGIIAQGASPAVGAALAAKLRGSDAVAVSYVGDGAANQGGFHEALNLAGLWKLP